MSHVLVLCTARGIPAEGPSGASAHLRGVSRALARTGAEVHVATPVRADHRGAHDPMDLPSTTCPPRRWPSWLREHGETWDARRLTHMAVRAARPDWIWERHTLFGDGGRRHPHRRLLELNAPLARERDRVRWPRRADRFERANLRAADRVVAVSAWLADWATDAGARDVRHVPNGTALTRVGDRAATRARLGLAGPVLGFVGSHKRWHGLDRIPAILEAVPEAMALVVGSGPTTVPPHPRLVAVPWTGTGLADLVSAMDVGLLPYPPDAPPWFCPLKVFDYRAQGVPVVASDVGELASLADVVVDPAAGAWAAAIRAVVDRPRVVRCRSWDDVVQDAAGDWLGT